MISLGASLLSRAGASVALAIALVAGYAWVRRGHLEEGRVEVRAEWAAERRQAELQAEQRREINRATARHAPRVTKVMLIDAP